MLTQKVTVLCDNCGEQCSHKQSEILRNVIDIPRYIHDSDNCSEEVVLTLTELDCRAPWNLLSK